MLVRVRVGISECARCVCVCADLRYHMIHDFPCCLISPAENLHEHITPGSSCLPPEPRTHRRNARQFPREQTGQVALARVGHSYELLGSQKVSSHLGRPDLSLFVSFAFF